MNYTKTQHTKPYAAISPSLPHLSTKSKSVFITGGSAGIGKAVALAFLEAGSCHLAITGRREAVLSAAATEIKTTYPDAQVLTFVADIADEVAMNKAFSGAKEAFGAPIDIAINGAGYLPSLKPLATSDLNDWWLGYETNVKGAAIFARGVAKYAASDAVVLHLATAGVMFPANGGLPMSGYATSKLAGVKVMEYFGAENPGLRVVSVHPGVVTESEGGQKMVAQSDVEWQGDDSKFPFSVVIFSLLVVCLANIYDLVNLGAHFLVWAASKEAEFLKNKLVFAAWDVEELKARKDEIAQSPELLIGLNGFPRNV
ncbi:putative short-chain dehydrogenase [Hypoxylon trugodes]|uniref:putative short-chain dehydrogenase n=1 Tax=Hypoxylon trugodes TaxID=326681 RepID=UPI00219C9A57|nr:putative short-chain dehydrogenase [Hypoxylon trugodes]KAI1385070.1 putative short-chain dehydrogenase [Hypoxylon trugodes]